jgi:hypothetical protein
VKNFRIYTYTILSLLITSGYSQNLIDESRTEIILSDGTSVTLYKAHSFEEPYNLYYYLPVNMHVATREDMPEISLLVFNEDSNRSAILHFLLTWGLSSTLEEEMDKSLKLKINDTAYIAGPVLVEAAPVSFQITGNDPLVNIMNKSMSNSSTAPVIPGLKLAASFRFTGADADYLTDLLKKPGKEINGAIRMVFTYSTMIREGYISKSVYHEWILEMGISNIIGYLKTGDGH